MSHIFLSKKKQVYIFLIFLFIITFVNYLYQSNYTAKLYTVNLTLKNNILFHYPDVSNFSDKIDLERNNQVRSTVDEFYNALLLKIEEKTNYEINYDKNLLQISSKCEKLTIEIQRKYYFFNCITQEPEELINTVITSFSNILTESMNEIQLDLIVNNLLKLGMVKKENNLERFIVVKKQIKYNKNALKNIILLDSILVFIFIFYILNFRKIKKIFF